VIGSFQDAYDPRKVIWGGDYLSTGIPFRPRRRRTYSGGALSRADAACSVARSQVIALSGRQIQPLVYFAKLYSSMNLSSDFG
jgi:hypothetical protein